MEKYIVDQRIWQDMVVEKARALSESMINNNQIVNYFTIDRFGLWNCAKEISEDLLTDQITDFISNDNSFVPVRIYVFNDRYSVYMSKDIEMYNNHFYLNDIDTRVLAKDKKGNMFVCNQKETRPEGFKLFFEPINGATTEELNKLFEKVG